MADKSNNPNTSEILGRSFTKGMVKDLSPSIIPEDSWSHARNLKDNSDRGDLAMVVNEPSNTLCTQAPYDITGRFTFANGTWIITSTDNVDSEIGLFNPENCSYNTIINDACLSFKQTHLITGLSKKNSDGSYQIYFADGLNNDKTLKISEEGILDELAYKGAYQTLNGTPCLDYIQDTPLALDCDKARLEQFMKAPKIQLSKDLGGGQLLNGSYSACIAYTDKSVKISDYSTPSNVQGLFTHADAQSSLKIELELDSENFEEFELVIIRNSNQNTRAYKIGIYSTSLTTIVIDSINEALVTVPLVKLPINTQVYEKSESISKVGAYLLRLKPTGKFDFNYQPLANLIKSEWVIKEYPGSYYHDHGNNTAYLMDEQYAFFVRWIYNTGDKSASYHIPGRAGTTSEKNIFKTQNTARTTAINLNTPTADGGVILAKGDMGYWESSEKYPDKQPEVWNSTYWKGIWSSQGILNSDSTHNLCGTPIRHHKMPDPTTGGDELLLHKTVSGQERVRLLGVQFSNIEYPVDNDGNPIPNIQGYEILRGSREGNKSIIAKGIFNNMMNYTVAGNGKAGLYQNYPYNDNNVDHFLSETRTKNHLGTVGQPKDYKPFTAGSSETNHTFHSPDTTFKQPFLNGSFIKLYTKESGDVIGNHDFAEDHPKLKLMSNLALVTSGIIGLGLVIASSIKKSRKLTSTVETGSDTGLFIGLGSTNAASAVTTTAAVTAANIQEATANTAGTVEEASGISDAAAYFSGGLVPRPSRVIDASGKATLSTTTSPSLSTKYISSKYDDEQNSPTGFEGAPGTFIELTWGVVFRGSRYANDTLELLRALVDYQDYVLSYTSHGFYNNSVALPQTNVSISDARYLGDSVQEFGTARINNLFRTESVVVNANLGKTTGDNSRMVRVRDIKNTVYNTNVSQNSNDKDSYENPTQSFSRTTTTRYGSIKLDYDNQYGQLDSIKQLPTDNINRFSLDEYNASGAASTDVIYGGDTYVNRYTEKNTFFLFHDWLKGQPDGYEYDYTKREMIAHPAFWLNSVKYDVSEFMQSLNPVTLITNIIGNTDPFGTPDDRHSLDRYQTPGNAFRFVVKKGYMYQFISGVRDFYTESEINLAARDWEDTNSKRFYDPYAFTDLPSLFEIANIKKANYYKYNWAMSISKQYGATINWGYNQLRSYNPFESFKYLRHYDKRVIYSMPQQSESLMDSWRVFLANDYKDFVGEPLVIKPISKNGSILLFKNESPVMFQGTENMSLDSGTKLTIGDGSLFGQPLQNLSNADESYEYGSCQDSESVINTPFGLFWMSQEQGKVFSYAGGLKEISSANMTWWFKKYLPFKILEQFPNFSIVNNPVVGVGCQSIYDNNDKMLFFSKRDFRVKEAFKYLITYNDVDDTFYLSKITPVTLGDPRYFDDASWTISYNPKKEYWISFHDWKPNLNIPNKNDYFTIKGGAIWLHNNTNQSYCNFYGQDYPFEIETIFNTGQLKTTTRSFEYLLECYQFDTSGNNAHHILEENFDKALIYNTEQISGELNLNLKFKNDILNNNKYPIINTNSIDILYSKEENVYRFNQFWDITDDRGEFTNARRTMFLNNPDGYTRNINPTYVNYNKPLHQRKKFRHYLSGLRLIKTISAGTKMVLKIVNSKNQISIR